MPINVGNDFQSQRGVEELYVPPPFSKTMLAQGQLPQQVWVLAAIVINACHPEVITVVECPQHAPEVLLLKQCYSTVYAQLFARCDTDKEPIFATATP